MTRLLERLAFALVVAAYLAALFLSAGTDRPPGQLTTSPPPERPRGDAMTGARTTSPADPVTWRPRLSAAPSRAKGSLIAAATTRQAARAGVVTLRDGWASTYGPGWPDSMLAIPEGPGYVVRICGPVACITRVSNDAGPDLAMQRRGRVADLSVRDFEFICACDWHVGLVPVQTTIVGRVR